MFFANLHAACMRPTSRGITPWYWERFSRRRCVPAIRCCSFAGATRGLFLDQLLRAVSMMPANRIAGHTVLQAPFISHLAANLPQLWKKLVSHAIFQNFYRPPLQRL